MKLSFAFFSAFLLLLTSVAQGQTPSATVASQAASLAGPEDQAKNLTRQIFLAEARARDLVGLVETGKMTDSEKAAFQQDAGSVESGLQTLEKWRYQFLYHPDDAGAASQELQAFDALLPGLAKLTDALTRFGSATNAQQFKQALGEMTGLRNSLESYLESRFPGQFVPPAAPTSQTSGTPTPAQVSPSSAATGVRPASPVAEKLSPQPGPAQGTTTAQPPAPAPAAAALEPDQMRALLESVYLADARVSDLLSLLQPAKWKMTDSERALFNEHVQSIGNQLKTVEASRYQFLYDLHKPELGEQTASALGGLVDQLLGVESTVAQYQGQADAAQLAQVTRQLAAARNSVGAYAAALEAEGQRTLAASTPALPGGKTLTTERIIAPSGEAPPLSSLAVAAPPLAPSQVKSILENVYVSEYRIRDLLGQEHPEAWKAASASERTLASQARATLLSRLDELEKWRSSFSQNPGNMNDAFRMFRAVDALFRPLWIFGREAGKYENQQTASDYGRREDDMEAQLNGLVPYVSFIFEHADRNLGTFEADLATCQNQLSYAMHGAVPAAQPMRNIVPVFKGRRVRHTDRANSRHKSRESRERKEVK